MTMLDPSSKESLAFPPRLLDGLDHAAFEELCRTTDDETYRLKYSDLDRWVMYSWKHAAHLGLDTSPPLDILDLGLGPGYFAYVCQVLGHRCVGLDLPGGSSFKQALRKWLGIESFVEFAIMPKIPLPPMGRFDLVTAYHCQFNHNLTERRLWNIEEWTYFLDDLRENVLKPGGRFVLRLTKQTRKGRGGGVMRDDPKLNALFQERGAPESKGVIIFDPLT